MPLVLHKELLTKTLLKPRTRRLVLSPEWRHLGEDTSAGRNADGIPEVRLGGV